MGWLYKQKTGELSRAGLLVGTDYAGRDYDDAGNFVGGKNNPAMQNVKGIGPLPVGFYTIEPPADDPVVGQFAMRLVPDAANEMFGRASFFMHGDSSEHPGLASHGCIVQVRPVRERVAASGDNRLEVVPGESKGA